MNKKLFIAGIFVLSTFFLFSFAQAQYNYQPLEEIPGFGKIADFPGFILAVYKFGIWTVAIAALLMITIGGFMYLTSAGNMSKNDTAKGIIQDALIGLIIAMVAYLILFVINPDLVKIKLDMQAISPGGSTPAAPGTGGSSPTAPNPPAAPSVGCGKTVDAAEAMASGGCCYCAPGPTPPRGTANSCNNPGTCTRNSCNGNPGYTDCSDFVSTSYKKAGCNSPGETTSELIKKAKSDKSSLKAGDLLVANSGGKGHVVMCKNDGCSKVIHASGSKDGIREANSSKYLNDSGYKAIRASDYCKNC